MDLDLFPILESPFLFTDPRSPIVFLFRLGRIVQARLIRFACSLSPSPVSRASSSLTYKHYLISGFVVFINIVF